MIWINQGQSNEIAVTLTENCTLSQPNFLFRFVNDETHNEYAFIASDESQFPARYNKFTILETSDPDTLDGEIELPKTGLYHYYIYEQESDSNLDYTLSTGLVEQGKLTVPGDSPTVNAYTPANTEIKSYEPQN
jgi:hypothetical protein